MFTNIKKFINNSFFMDNIDNISYVILLLLVFFSVFAQSEFLGMFSLLFSLSVLFKVIFKKQVFNLEFHEKALIIYFLIVTVSLFASTLFKLSFHGYIKTLIYILFYFCASFFFRENKNKITPLIFLIFLCSSFEAVVAIIQNHLGIVEISGWQDTTNLNPEQIISRAYGTLKPYNPNLLAGYLLCSLGSYIYLFSVLFVNSKKKSGFLFLSAFIVAIVAIIDTGCRGAYLGFLFFFPALFFGLLTNCKKQFIKFKLFVKTMFLISIILLF